MSESAPSNSELLRAIQTATANSLSSLSQIGNQMAASLERLVEGQTKLSDGQLELSAALTTVLTKNGHGEGRFNLQNSVTALALLGSVFMFLWTQIAAVARDATTRQDTIESRFNSAARELKIDLGDVRQQVGLDMAGLENIREKQKELETQLHGRDVYENARLMMEQRLFGQLWKRAYNEELPEWRYFPPEAKPGSELNGGVQHK